MKLSVVFTLIALTVLIALLDQSEAGLLRRSRRLRRIGPPRHHNVHGRRNGGGNRRSARVFRMGRGMRWPHFLAPPRGFSEARSAGRRHPERREEFFRHAPHQQHQQLRLPLMAAHSEPMLMSGSTQLNSWRPIDQGPALIDRDPTYDYAPPSLERVKFSESKEPHQQQQQHPLKRKPKKPTRPEKEHMMRGKKPRPNGSPMFGRPIRRPSIWKLLATKQRRRPYPPPPQKHRRPPQAPFLRYPENGDDEKEEAEIFPRIPNILYFQHADVLANAMNNHPRPPTRLQPVAHHPTAGAPHRPPPPGTPHHPPGTPHHAPGAPHHPPAALHNRPPTIVPPQHPPTAHHQHQHQQQFPQNPVRNNPPMMHLPSSSTQLNRPGMKPGMITNVPLYSHENQSPSLFNPVTPPMNNNSPPPPAPTPSPVAPIPQKPSDILYRPQEFMNPTRRPLNGPSILQPVQQTTPLTLAGATRNTAMKPVQPTQSLFDSVVNDPPKPIQLNSEYSILSSVNSVLGRINSNELTDDSSSLPVLSPAVEERRRPVFSTTTTTTTEQSPPVSAENNNNNEEESTTIHVSTSVSHSTSFSIGTSSEATAIPNTTSTSTTTTTTEKPTTKIPVTTTTTTKSTTARYQRLPEMPTYKKRQPIYPKRITPIRSSSFSSIRKNSQESKSVDPSSSEAIVVMSRSKVKNYKPQFLANYTQLLTFDKVEETAADLNNNNGPVSSVTVSPSFTKVTSNKPTVDSPENNNEEISLNNSENSEDSSSSSSTTKSPMENFDPMQLLHSWFQNT